MFDLRLKNLDKRNKVSASFWNSLDTLTSLREFKFTIWQTFESLILASQYISEKEYAKLKIIPI